MEHFGICLTEYGETAKLLTICSKREAIDFLENYTNDYLTSKNGVSSDNKVYEANKSGPIGVYKTRNPKESMTKLTVWQKIRNKGRLYHSYTTKQLFTIDIISISDTVVYFPNPSVAIDEYQCTNLDSLDKDTIRILCDEVHAELKQINLELETLENEIQGDSEIKNETYQSLRKSM